LDQRPARRPWQHEARQCCRQGAAMKLFQDLFFTDYGLMSFIGIMFMIGMAIFFLRLFTRK
jgi:hypothetical protein